MRFTELRPTWRDEGVAFDCPTHRTHRLAIRFGFMWTRNGQTFDSLTITPAIDASRDGCAHFEVTNGEVKIL